MARELTLEREEWYVLCNWLRERENRLMYALRDRSAEWEFVHDLRRAIEDPRDDAPETSAVVRAVTLSESQFEYLSKRLRRRALVLRLKPWRDRERRDVRRLRRRILAEVEADAEPTVA